MLPDESLRVVELARLRGAIVLPVDRLAFERNPVGGFMARHWGPGWPFIGEVPTKGCPLLLFVGPETARIHWAVRAVPCVAPGGALQRPRGQLRLAAHPALGSQGGGLSAVALPVDLDALPEAPDDHGGWTFGGTVEYSSTEVGYQAVVLSGSCDGIRIITSAVSTTRR